MKKYITIILCPFVLLFYLQLPAQQQGKLDKSFAQNGVGTYGVSRLGLYSTANSTCIQPDGKIILAGETDYNGGTSIAVVRLNTDGSRDSSFGGDGLFIIPKSTFDKYEYANAVAMQADGKIVLAGSSYDEGWDNSGEILLVRLNSNGSLDKSFNGSGKKYINVALSQQATSLVIQPDDRIVVAGHTNKYLEGSRRKNFLVARLNGNGSPDKSFGKNGVLEIAVGRREDEAHAVALQPDGKILLAGSSYDLNSQHRFAVVRLNSNGSLDSAFNKTGKFTAHISGFYDIATSVLVQADNKIVLAGNSFDYKKNKDDFSVLCLNSNGSLDSSFNEDGKLMIAAGAGDNYAHSAALQQDGKILLAGHDYSTNYKSNYAVVRLSTNGYPDSGFNKDGRLSVPVGDISDGGNAVAVQSNGKIIVAGYSLNNRNWSDFSVIGLNSDGSLNKSFNGNGKLILPIGNSDDYTTAMAITPADKIVVAGFSDMIGQALNFSLIRLNKDGSLDNTFNEDGKFLWPDNDTTTTQAYAVTVQPDGKTLVAGVSYANGNGDFLILRLNDNGKLDSSFNNTGKLSIAIGNSYDNPRAIAIQPNGKIIVAGYSYNGSDYDFSAIRININGTLDNGFDDDGKLLIPISGTNEYLGAVSIQPDGKIVLAGSGTVDGKRSFFIIRLNSNGKPDNSFDTDGRLNVLINASSRAHALAIQEDGKIVAAGESYDSYPNYNVALIRLNSNGSFDNSFGEGGKFIMPSDEYDGYAKSIAIQPDGKIVVSSNGALLIRLNKNGGLDSSFGENGKARPSRLLFNGALIGIALQQDGNIVAAGYDKSPDSRVDFAVMRFLGNNNANTENISNTVTTNKLLNEKDFIKVWPVPARNIIHIQLKGNTDDNITMQIADMHGKLVKREQIVAAKTVDQQINISALTNGMYILTISNKHCVKHTEKIVIKK